MSENITNSITNDTTTAPASRQERLKAWLSARGLTLAKLGLALGMTAEGARLMLKVKTVNPIRFAQLRARGIPVDLLPSPEFRKASRPAPRVSSPLSKSFGPVTRPSRFVKVLCTGAGSKR